jgi:hypothetical protein
MLLKNYTVSDTVRRAEMVLLCLNERNGTNYSAQQSGFVISVAMQITDGRSKDPAFKAKLHLGNQPTVQKCE